MLPLNPWMLLGLAGVLIPILIHIFTRQSGQRLDWGAMQFLRDSLVVRTRRIHLEEALLMAARCCVVLLLVLALARPFIPPGSSVPWFVVLPLGLLATLAVTVGVVLWELPKWRSRLILAGLLMGVAALGLVLFEKHLNLSRFSQGGRQDVAIILDVSTSMSLKSGGRSNLERALDEIREVLRRSPRGHAFSLILGGPAPTARVLLPTGDRERLLRELAAVEPLSGSMAAYDCLTLATLALAQGSNRAKEVLIYTDGQPVGWKTNQGAKWAYLREALQNLSSTPKVVVREMPLPRQVRNLALRDIVLSRGVVGTDRPVSVEVTVENTGTEAVSPGALELTAGDKVLTNRTLGQILPGTTDVVRFEHRFSVPGAHVLQARLAVEDEIADDNSLAKVLRVQERLGVLIVDGAFGGSVLERAGTMAALALAPGNARPKAPGEDQSFLIDPVTISAVEFARMKSLDGYKAVLLADVPRLPSDALRLLENFVELGGGLLLAPGDRADGAFYNTWKGPDGNLFLPARFGTLDVAPAREPLALALDTFRHPALRVVADEKQSDLGSVGLARHWKLDEEGIEGAVVGGRLRNGNPFLLTRRVGLGQVMLLASSLDLRGGTLPLRQAFVPFLHELVYFLSGPARDDLNLEANWELVLHLSGDDESFSGQGLQGEYFLGKDRRTPKLVRFDPSIQFDWKEGSPAPEIPADQFSVRWTGSILAPASGRYQFEADADDILQVFVDGRNVLRQGLGERPRSRPVWLDANREHDVKLEYEERKGNAMAVLYWQIQGKPRQIVPPSAFRHADQANRKVLAEYAVEGPGTKERRALLEATPGGVAARIQGDISAGLYLIRVPEADRSKFGKLIAEGSAVLPFTVNRDPAESRMEAFTSAQRAFLQQHLGIVYPDSAEGVLQILQGKSFGEELWRPLAVAAMLLLLLEVALTRWISVSRRTGQEEAIRFG